MWRLRLSDNIMGLANWRAIELSNKSMAISTLCHTKIINNNSILLSAPCVMLLFHLFWIGQVGFTIHDSFAIW